MEDDDAEELLKKIDDQHNIAEILEAELIPYSLEYYLGVAQNDDANLEDYMNQEDDSDEEDCQKGQSCKKKKC